MRIVWREFVGRDRHAADHEPNARHRSPEDPGRALIVVEAARPERTQLRNRRATPPRPSWHT